MPLVVTQFAPRVAVSFPPRAYLDTNFIVTARDAAAFKYQAASACLGELIVQNVQLNLSALVFDELWWAYLRKSFNLLTGSDLTPQKYKASPAIIRPHWQPVQVVMGIIRGWGGFNELPTPPGVVDLAEALMDTNNLLPRDAFHLALVLHHGIESFVTLDSDFDNVQLPAGANLTLIKV